MTGAPTLAATAAFRSGAGYVRLSVPGGSDVPAPLETVVVPVPARDWADAVLADLQRFRVLAVGPGLGRSDDAAAGVRAVLDGAAVPVVVDGDALWLLGTDVAATLRGRPAPTVLTPHDGEFERLTGAPPGEDRPEAARSLAAATGAVVLLKGPTTVVADPDGSVLLVRSGDARLATAGTGDVLTGVVAAFVASGAEPARAAAAAPRGSAVPTPGPCRRGGPPPRSGGRDLRRAGHRRRRRGQGAPGRLVRPGRRLARRGHLACGSCPAPP